MVTDIYEAFLQLNNNNHSNTLDDIMNLADAIKRNHKKVYTELQQLIHNKAERYNLCPECFSELMTSTTYEPSEYNGRPVQEEINHQYCPKCKWSAN